MAYTPTNGTPRLLREYMTPDMQDISSGACPQANFLLLSNYTSCVPATGILIFDKIKAQLGLVRSQDATVL